MLLIFLILTFSACSQANIEYQNTVEVADEEPGAVVYSGYHGAELPQDIPYEYIKHAIAAFSQRLFREVLATNGSNAVISPLGVYYVLTMVALGARDETLYEFESLLGANPQSVAPALSAMTQSIMDVTEGTNVNMVSSAWLSDEFDINPEFHRFLADHFHACLYSVDLTNPLTVHEINDWVYNQSEGFIDEVIQEIDIYVLMLLINSLHLSARWARTFNPMGESLRYFYPELYVPFETTFISTNHIILPTYVADYFDAVMLPYDDDRLGFVIVRPRDGMNIRCFAGMHCIYDIVNRLAERREVMVSLPKFDISYSICMNSQLQMMGLISAFDENIANFSGLIYDESYQIYLSEVRQTIRLRVDSEGTEAAAVTVGMPALSDSPYQPIELYFNSPFLYFIYDMYESVILFKGVVDYPRF